MQEGEKYQRSDNEPVIPPEPALRKSSGYDAQTDTGSPENPGQDKARDEGRDFGLFEVETWRRIRERTHL